MSRLHSVFLRVLCVSVVSSSWSFAASPTLTGILPRGGQRGTTVAVTFSGANLADAQEAFCYSPGIKVSEFKAVNNNQVTAKFAIAPDCRLGEYAFRLRTATGV